MTNRGGGYAGMALYVINLKYENESKIYIYITVIGLRVCAQGQKVFPFSTQASYLTSTLET